MHMDERPTSHADLIALLDPASRLCEAKLRNVRDQITIGGNLDSVGTIVAVTTITLVVAAMSHVSSLLALFIACGFGFFFVCPTHRQLRMKKIVRVQNRISNIGNAYLPEFEANIERSRARLREMRADAESVMDAAMGLRVN